MTQNRLNSYTTIVWHMFMVKTVDCTVQWDYGTICIDTDDVRIGMLENLWAPCWQKMKKEKWDVLSLIDMFLCYITRVACNCVWMQKQRQKNEAPSTSCEQAYVIDDSKIRIRHKGVPREWHSEWVIVMWQRLNSWWQPPKFCKIPWTSYNRLIMYLRWLIENIFLVIATWTRLSKEFKNYVIL